MAWGAPRGIDDILEDLAADTPGRHTLCLLRQRRFDDTDAVRLCSVLRGNTTLRDLRITSHAVSRAAAAAFSDMLAVNTGLTSLALGNRSFGDEVCDVRMPGSGGRGLTLHGWGLTNGTAGPRAVS